MASYGLQVEHWDNELDYWAGGDNVSVSGYSYPNEGGYYSDFQADLTLTVPSFTEGTVEITVSSNSFESP
ncbi:MAG: hypothetical protein QM760_20315 [Nibricoccus sp.]